MTVDAFWQRIESVIMDYGECDGCPVSVYAAETNTELMCDEVGDCAEGLKMLHKILEERSLEIERDEWEREE